ncbi:MAG: hypothetical protein M1833_005320 [Piccolia ochrophora]|nr:MAG: hypothetical protein M1833_005320 [Piccolia ochrophora]
MAAILGSRSVLGLPQSPAVDPADNNTLNRQQDTPNRLPNNVKSFYDAHKPGNCPKTLAGGFRIKEGGATVYAYCEDQGVIYLHGPDRFVDMDIDCDGDNSQGGNCANDPSGLSITAFRDEVRKYGIRDLDANKHPYVVFGNDLGFDPIQFGLKPLSVMAVVCNSKLHYGIWGDINGDTLTGEASISLGDLCFPEETLNGNKGHGKADVLYIGFPGAKPSSKWAWKAGNARDFEASIKAEGDRLIQKLS